ncbi:unnamed protein product, partial [Mesorhabditis belari]|uniref:BHLH domain-containing protein n=1 Tax=Mesorhabditis belari TaxID=2138241 RepID=A0AAF3F254_9BILA
MSTSGSDNQTPSPSSRGSFVEKLLNDDDLEPYVRRKNSESEAKRRMEGLNEEEQNVLRTSINSRERKRMHDLNDAMDDLRSCLPKVYTDGPGARRLSKINTLMLAANRIRQLIQLNEKLVSENAHLRSLSSSSQSQFKEDVPPSDLPIPTQSSTPRITTIGGTIVIE